MSYVVFGTLFTFGCLSIFLGIILRLGRLRTMYTLRSVPVYAQREIFNLTIPIGLGFLAIALPIIYPTTKDWADYLLSFSFWSTIILAIWQPWWLKPAWLRWLEDNYGHVMEDMFTEARTMGRRKWAEQVKTQEGLEQWADGVAKKNGWRRKGK